MKQWKCDYCGYIIECEQFLHHIDGGHVCEECYGEVVKVLDKIWQGYCQKLTGKECGISRYWVRERIYD